MSSFRQWAFASLFVGLTGAGCAATMPAALYCPSVEAPYHYPEKAWSSATEGAVEVERCPVDSGFPPLTVISGPKVLADSLIADLSKETHDKPLEPRSEHTCYRQVFQFRINPTDADILVETPPSTLVTRGLERPQIVSRGTVEDAVPEDKWVPGVIKVRAVVDPDGVVSDARLLEGAGPELDPLVVAWVKTFRFCPARLRGKRISAPFVFAASFLRERS